MAPPTRRGAPLGTSESIYEDLKFVRQAGGFVMARNEDLAGTMAALTASDAKAADSHFILAKRVSEKQPNQPFRI